MSTISPIIQPEELVALAKLQPLVLIDASTGPDAQNNYTTRHLNGALHVSLDDDLAAVTDTPAEGGRHPLPTVEDFSILLGKLGITPDTHVVVYDNKNGANAAARFWWMLRAAGHAKVQVLNGGLEQAVAEGFEIGISAEAAQTAPPYPFTEWQLPTVTIDEVELAAANPDYIVVDVREAMRFDGIMEPIDLIAGHIPGAVNVPFMENLDDNGLFLNPEILRPKYTEAFTGNSPENVIVYCGSGVTACHTLLALDYAGLGIANLYIGSWSEWSRSTRKVAGGSIEL